MAKLTTKMYTTLAVLMIRTLDPKKSIIDEFKDEILRLLPHGTQMVGLKEITPQMYSLGREFELVFDCPFFQKDFEFDVEFHRNILADDTGIFYEYQTATKIIKLESINKENSNGSS